MIKKDNVTLVYSCNIDKKDKKIFFIFVHVSCNKSPHSSAHVDLPLSKAEMWDMFWGNLQLRLA